jgi:RNA polymerase sigma-70 factor (ECF subfamily)
VWSLLTVITLRKCADRVDYLRAKRRDVFRETPASEEQEAPWQLALDREPRPDEVAALSEVVEHLYRGVDDDDRGILELSLQGFSAAEIGLKLGRALRSVQRLRERIRKRLERHALECAGVGG